MIVITSRDIPLPVALNAVRVALAVVVSTEPIVVNEISASHIWAKTTWRINVKDSKATNLIPHGQLRISTSHTQVLGNLGVHGRDSLTGTSVLERQVETVQSFGLSPL